MKTRLWLVVIGLAAIHLLLRITVGLAEQAPDLLLVAALAGGRHQRFGSAAQLGMLAGLIDDSFAMTSFGASMVALSITAALGSQSMNYFVGRTWHFPLLYFGIGKAVRDLLGWAFSDPAVRTPFAEPLFLELIAAALYAAAAGFLVSWLFLPVKQPSTR